jgi:hypothetical protein
MHYEINSLQLTTKDGHTGNAHARLAADQLPQCRHSLRRWMIAHIIPGASTSLAQHALSR